MINVAVIGCGYWGPNIIRNFNQMTEVNMYVCQDLDKSKLDEIKRRFPKIKITENYDSILNDSKVDAVAI